MIDSKQLAALCAALGILFALSTNAQAQATTPSSVTDSRSDADTVVVKQGEVEVTLGDVDTWMLDIPEKDRVGFIRSPERIETMLFQMLLMKQLNREARATKLDQKDYIARHMKMAAERTLARYQAEEIRLAVKAPDMTDLAKEKYTANPEAFREPEIVTAVHLLITEKDRGGDAARKLIDKIYKQAQKKPAKLEELALKHSEDPTVTANRGRMENVSLATLDQAFAEATRSLKPGQLSKPVKSEFGWHLIRLDAIKGGRIPDFEEIKDAVRAAAEKEYVDRTIRGYFDGLRQRAMEPNPEVLEKLPFRYGGEAEPIAPTQPAAPAAEAKK